MSGPTSLRALLGSGPEGLGVPEPVDFATLVLPRSPNACLAAPAGDPRAQVTTRVFPVPPDQLMAALKQVALAQPRTFPLAEWPERRQMQWVERSALMNYPDIIAAEASPRDAGSALHLYSRSLFGWSDMGVNRKRVLRWLAVLDIQRGLG